jgi:hypothetical protein
VIKNCMDCKYTQSGQIWLSRALSRAITLLCVQQRVIIYVNSAVEKPRGNLIVCPWPHNKVIARFFPKSDLADCNSFILFVDHRLIDYVDMKMITFPCLHFLLIIDYMDVRMIIFPCLEIA